MSDDISRRNLLRAGAAATVGPGVVGTAAAEGETASQIEGQIPCRNLTGADLPTTVSTSEPLPEQATGVRPGSQMFVEYPDGTTAGCTANFIWRDLGDTAGLGDAEESANADETDIENSKNGSTGEDIYYIGAAGHCFLPTGIQRQRERPAGRRGQRCRLRREPGGGERLQGLRRGRGDWPERVRQQGS